MNDDTMITFIEAMLYEMEGENPFKAIENQERRGQQSVIKNQILPKKINDILIPREILWNGIKDSMKWEKRNKIINHNNIEYTKKQYEKMGIIIIEEFDDLFWSVKLPENWEIRKTEHSMWSDLFDDKGRKRAEIFYKSSFYDRDAFINFKTRFTISANHTADVKSDYEIWEKSDYQGIVKDGENIIFRTECVPITGDYEKDDEIKSNLRKILEEYMDKHYPNYKDIHSYWN